MPDSTRRESAHPGCRTLQSRSGRDPLPRQAHLHTGNILYSQVCKLLPGTKKLTLDLCDVNYMDSMGLGTLVRIYVSTKSAGCQTDPQESGQARPRTAGRLASARSLHRNRRKRHQDRLLDFERHGSTARRTLIRAVGRGFIPGKSAH